MPLAKLNRIRNGDFASGRKGPTSWQWEALAGTPTWRLLGDGTNGTGRRLLLETDREDAAGQWSQSFRCRGKHTYRIEILASCRPAARAAGGGLGVRIRCFDHDGLMKDSEQSYRPWRSTEAAWWRAQYRTPKEARRMEVSIRLEGIRGRAELHRIRAIPMDYVCAEPHPISVPPWPYVYPRPLRVRTIDVVDETERGERVAEILRARFGARSVKVRSADRVGRSGDMADAVIVSSGEDLPRAWTWNTVLNWASERMVVLSLPAFQQLVNRRVPDCVRVRSYRQEDDTLGAKVAHANFITNGFALLDIFDFSTFDTSDGSFRQRQIIRSAALRQFLQAQSMEIILTSDSNMDASSGRPLCLHKSTPGGGIVVLDCDPLVSPFANDQQPNIAAQLLMNVLGADTANVGQLADPNLPNGAFVEQIRSMSRQMPGIRLTWTPAVASAKSRPKRDPQAVVTVGAGRDAGRGLRLPLLLVRTGLDQSGRFGIEGATVWIKNLARPEPCVARYADMLLSRRRIAWVPFAGRVSTAQIGAVVDTGHTALVVDVVPTDRNVLRVVLPERGRLYRAYARLLGALDSQLRRGRVFGRLPAAGGSMHDRDQYAWRSDETPLEVVADAEAFAGTAAQVPPATRRVRVEVPVASPPSAAHSILETDRIGLLLEWIAGLEIGAVAVNRDPRPRKIVLPALADPALARILAADGRERAVKPAEMARLAKQGLRLGPGATLLLERSERLAL